VLGLSFIMGATGAGMSVDRQTIDAMVCKYLAAGGRVRKMPAPTSATPAQVLKYLKEQKVDVTLGRAKNAYTETKYRHRGEIISWEALVELANRLRRKQKLPPF
jgi:hypothetical protein